MLINLGIKSRWFLWQLFYVLFFLWIAIALGFSYFRFFPNNLWENLSMYYQLTDYLLQLKIDGTIRNVRDSTICRWINRCDCINKVCLLNGRNIYDIMDDLDIDHINLNSTVWIVKIYPKKEWWSVWCVFFDYHKNAFSLLEWPFPFYKKSGVGTVYDSKINDDWVIIRSWYLRQIYWRIPYKD